ncbi:hypothetical protein VTL71DRAFT_11658, partial [Oculimacula yallundae]
MQIGMTVKYLPRERLLTLLFKDINYGTVPPRHIPYINRNNYSNITYLHYFINVSAYEQFVLAGKIQELCIEAEGGSRWQICGQNLEYKYTFKGKVYETNY